jgi:hypothetical protein
MTHMNGRIYDQSIGQFTSADPIIDGVGITQGWNRYGYLHGNPLNSRDPSGHGDHNNVVKNCQNCDQGPPSLWDMVANGYGTVTYGAISRGTVVATQHGEVRDGQTGEVDYDLGYMYHVFTYLGGVGGNPSTPSNPGPREPDGGGPGGPGGPRSAPPREEDTIEEVVVSATAISRQCWSMPPLQLASSDGGTRTPDYVVATIPLWRYVGLTVTLDKEANLYIGPSVGVNFLSRGGRSAGVGWTSHNHAPSSRELQDWLSGAAFNFGLMGPGFTWSSPQNLDPSTIGTNLQVSGASLGWNFHVADINVSVCN